MAGFISGLADQLGNVIDDKRATAAYAPLLDAVYGAQPQQHGGGFLSNLLGMGQGPVPATSPTAGAPDAQMPAPPGAMPVQAPGMGGGAPQIDRAAIMGLLSNPATREQGAALLMNGGRMPQGRNTLPADLQEYQFAQQQGFKGTFLDYQTALRQAGRSSTNVTVNSGAGENEFQKTFGKGQAERYNTMIEQGDQANNMIGDIKTLQDIGTRIQTGAGAQAKLLLGPYAQAFGIDIKGLDDLQAYQSVVSRLAPQMRVPGSGANSDFEARQFLLSLPTLGNTPGGNKLIEDTLLGIAQNKRAAGDIARQAGTGQITRQQADQMLQALPDPFTAFRQSGAATTPPPAGTPAQGAPDADGWVTLPNGVRVRQKGQ